VIAVHPGTVAVWRASCVGCRHGSVHSAIASRAPPATVTKPRPGVIGVVAWRVLAVTNQRERIKQVKRFKRIRVA
jgi:hypothetical protein